MINPIIAPSILAANLGDLKQDLELINQSSASWIHIDVMDGSFVPPITFGDNVVSICRKHSKKFLDVHLMTNHPEKHFQSFINAGAQSITFHLEATDSPLKLLDFLKKNKVQAGLAIKPNTPWESFHDLINSVDLLLIMTVEPGYGGQKFMPEMLDKIKLSSDLICKNQFSAKIQVDGGINQETGKLCYQAGAEIFVAGSYIFNHPDPKSQINNLSFK